MAESKLDLPEDLIGSKSSDQSWIPKGNPWLFFFSFPNSHRLSRVLIHFICLDLALLRWIRHFDFSIWFCNAAFNLCPRVTNQILHF